MERAGTRTGIGWFRVSGWLGVAALILACHATSCFSQTDGPVSYSNAIDRMQALLPVYSPTRRFAAIGADPRQKQDALSWAEDVALRIEKTTLQHLLFENRELRMVLRKDEDQTNGWVSASEAIDGRRLIQRLTIANYDAIDLETVMTQLCRLLLAGQIYAAGSGANAGARWDPAAVKRAAAVPHWLACGVAQNLYPSLRARNSNLVLDAWLSGKAPPAHAILTSAEPPHAADGVALTGSRADRFASAECGVFVAWILSTPDSDMIVGAILSRLNAGDPITREWLSAHMLTGSTDTLNDGWDRWMLRLKRTISEPGSIPSAALDPLAAELLLYPGLSGIPSSSREKQAFGFDLLITERRAGWAEPFASAKKNRLQMLKIGRDPRYQAVVDAYCEFLDGLVDQRSEKRLRRMLEAARRLDKALPRPARPEAVESNHVERNSGNEEP